ncbi:MAG: T9SS type A sorting domain-containing protein [Bacteroidales bacterium]|nr:T9SS type A sorting domain-containing protein [Bacteroidales bacterium]
MKKNLLLLAIAALCFGQLTLAQDYHWPLTADLNDVVGGKNGTNSGVTFENDAVRGPVAYFNGDAYAKLPSFVNGNSEITIALWFRMDEVRPWSRIYSFGKGDQTEPKDVMMVIPVNGAADPVAGFYRFTLSDPDGPWADIDIDTNIVNIETGQWYFSAVVLKPDSIIVYHNNQQVFAESGFVRNLSTLEDNENALGKSFWPDALFKGALSDLRVYKSALSKSEIEAIYQLEPPSSVGNNSFNSNTHFYSNSNQIFVRSENLTGNEIVRVYNLMGSLVVEKPVSSLSSVQFNKGIYIVQLKGNTIDYTTKLLVK